MLKFNPKIIGYENDIPFGIMMVELEICPFCKKYMIEFPIVNTDPFPFNSNPFPKHYEYDFEAQVERVGWVKKSDVQIGGPEYICEICKEQGSANFKCHICKKTYLTREIQETIFGDPSEYLCKSCYENVPAKVWFETIDRLKEIHQYDYD